MAKRKDVPRGLTKKAVAQFVDAVFVEIGDFFIRSKGGRKPAKFTYPRFGTFTKRRRNARPVRNPATGTTMVIPSKVTITFSPGNEMRELMNDQPKVTQKIA